MHAYIDDLNYYSDSRVTSKRATVLELDGKPLPYRWEVCSLCDGRGSHVNPSVDAGGLSAEDFAEDPDFAEDYFRGTYDVPCARCAGRTTVPVINVGACTFAQKRYLVELRREERSAAETESIYRAERAMGA